MGYFMCQLFEGSKARSLWKINGINEANDITLTPSLFQLGILTTKEVSCVREIWHLQCAPHCSKFFKKLTLGIYYTNYIFLFKNGHLYCLEEFYSFSEAFVKCKKSYWSWWPTNVQLWHSYYFRLNPKLCTMCGDPWRLHLISFKGQIMIRSSCWRDLSL